MFLWKKVRTYLVGAEIFLYVGKAEPGWDWDFVF